jgi:hypothetical protein
LSFCYFCHFIIYFLVLQVFLCLLLLLQGFFQIVPIALTKEQIKQYNPPPNPAKITDPRAKDFIEKHGKTSWEVDALKPEVLNEILKQAIEENIDIDKFEEILAEEEADKEKIEEIKNKL